MANGVTSHQADIPTCPDCGTPIRHGLTTQYMTELDAEVCAVCEKPLNE